MYTPPIQDGTEQQVTARLVNAVASPPMAEEAAR